MGEEIEEPKIKHKPEKNILKWKRQQLSLYISVLPSVIIAHSSPRRICFQCSFSLEANNEWNKYTTPQSYSCSPKTSFCLILFNVLVYFSYLECLGEAKKYLTVTHWYHSNICEIRILCTTVEFLFWRRKKGHSNFHATIQKVFQRKECVTLSS